MEQEDNSFSRADSLTVPESFKATAPRSSGGFPKGQAREPGSQVRSLSLLNSVFSAVLPLILESKLLIVPTPSFSQIPSSSQKSLVAAPGIN